MEDNTNQLNANPMLCKKNCGFFGNASCDGFCSKCYKEHVKKQNTGSAAGRVTPTTGLSSVSSSSSSSSSSNSVQISNTVESNAPSTANNQIPIASQSIPITTRQQSKLDEDFGMSVPSDLAVDGAPPGVATSSSADLAASVDESSLIGCSVGAEKKKRTRCCMESCKRKVGLTGYDCRCGGLYCWEHRYSDKHECKFDYKELGQDQIRKNNPVVIGEKIQKI